MNKEYKIKLDLNKKLYNKKMMFNQFDENVNDFYIEISKNNEVVKDLDKSIITLVAIKPNGEVDAQFIEIKDGQIYADLKPSMCDLIGNYTAKAMIVLEGEIVTTDTISYSVNEDKIISKLNNDIVSDERFEVLNDMLSRLSTIEINEANRENNFNDIKEQFEIIKNNHNELVTTQTDKKVIELLDPVIERVDNKINQVNNKISEVNEFVEAKEIEIDKNLDENTKKINDKIIDIEYKALISTNKVDVAISKIPPKSELIGPQGPQGPIGPQGIKGDTPSITHLETTVSNKVNEIETRFNTLTSKQQQSSEVIDARDGEASLKLRLERDIEKAKQIYSTVEGSNISVDSSVGYLKDIEILGNTVQDASNLADIRSVGDKLENQELYKIPVLCTNGLDSSDSNYKEYKLTILSPVQLEKVGDVADRIVYNKELQTWGVEKNIGILILDGSEDWKMSYGGLTAETRPNTMQFYSDALDILAKGSDSICNKLPNVQVYSVDIEGICLVGLDVNKLRIGHVSKSLDEFKKWLKQADVYVKFQLAQPQFIPLPYDQQVKLRTFANKTNIHFECEIEPTLKASVPKSIGASVSSNTTQIDNLSKELEKINNLEETVTSEVVSESDFITVENTNSGYFSDIKLEGKTLILNADNEVVEAGTEGATLKSVGQDVDEISVLSSTFEEYKLEQGSINPQGNIVSNTWALVTDFISVHQNVIYKITDNLGLGYDRIAFYDKNKNFLYRTDSYYGSKASKIKAIADSCFMKVSMYRNAPLTVENLPYIKVSAKQDKKRILYYNTETDTWEKPVLRQFDSIEKHSNNKYYYHVRSEEVPYTEGDETKADHITDMTTTVKKLSTEKVYECTNLDLITYSGETNLVTRSGVLNPKVTLKVKKGIGNVVTMLQNKVAMLEDLVSKLIQNK